MKKIYFILFLTFLMLPNFSFGQQVHPCGTPSHHTEWFNNYARNRTAYRTGADTTLYVPMTLHILGTDNGSGYISLMNLLDAVCGLNNHYSGSDGNMHYYIEGDIRYIDSTGWYNHAEAVDGYNMMMQHNVPNTINSYIVANPAGNAGYNLPSASAIALGKNSVNLTSSTWAHEIGHNLSVQHPFLGWEGNPYSYSTPTPATVSYNYTSFKKIFYNVADTTILDTAYTELVDGSNCAIAADKICDTPPDYLAIGGWGCNSAGMSNILQKDLNGVDFRSDGSNIMTYANSSCGAKFTPGQISAMRANLLTEKGSYLYNQGMQIDTITQNITQLHPTPSEVVDLNAVDFVWNKVDKATDYVLQVSFLPTFSTLHAEILTSDTLVTVNNFILNRKYYWRVRPFNKGYTCAAVSPIQDFTPSDLTAVNDIKGVENYRLYPNLIASGQPMNLDIKLTENLNANILIVSSNGQIVRQSNARFSIGQNEYPVATNGLSAGIYILVVQTENGIIRDKFVVGK
jgi:hypothetical protein